MLILNEFEYKGFKTILFWSGEDKVYHGKFMDITDLVTFESDTEENFEKEFHDAVEDYLIFKNEIANGKK